jgi:hypothetical protein
MPGRIAGRRNAEVGLEVTAQVRLVAVAEFGGQPRPAAGSPEVGVAVADQLGGLEQAVAPEHPRR